MMCRIERVARNSYSRQRAVMVINGQACESTMAINDLELMVSQYGLPKSLPIYPDVASGNTSFMPSHSSQISFIASSFC